MRYREQTQMGDYPFGTNTRFLVDTPATVAQAIKTRLKLYRGEWFLDTRIGLDLDTIIGYGTQATRDQEIQQRILGTTGVLSLEQYASSVDGRAFTVTATVNTIYGAVVLNERF
jgi:hypothetical protein